MSAREASTIDSEKNEQTTVNGVLDDEKELARMGYKQELKCANTLPSLCTSLEAYEWRLWQARSDAIASECLVLRPLV